MHKKIATLFIVFFSVLAVSSASAHGELVDSYPLQFANVNPIPTQVWLQFDGDLQSIDGETINTLEVEDSTGLVVSYGDAIIDGGRISTKISGQSVAGVFTVRYRIVSQDGHPVDGEYTFNASPDFSAVQQNSDKPAQSGPNLLVRGAALAAFLFLFLVVMALTKKKGSK